MKRGRRLSIARLMGLVLASALAFAVVRELGVAVLVASAAIVLVLWLWFAAVFGILFAVYILIRWVVRTLGRRVREARRGENGKLVGAGADLDGGIPEILGESTDPSRHRAS